MKKKLLSALLSGAILLSGFQFSVYAASQPEDSLTSQAEADEEAATETQTEPLTPTQPQTEAQSGTEANTETAAAEEETQSVEPTEAETKADAAASSVFAIKKPATNLIMSGATATSTTPAVANDITTTDAYKNYQDFRERYDVSASAVVPGAANTWLSSSVSCDAMVTQGLCLADATSANGKRYLLVSAYCGSTTRDSITGARTGGDHNHKSVIYVVDADTKEYVTTIVLPTYGHVGGVCYDGKYVWYSISYDDNKKTGTSQTTQTVNDVKYTIPASKNKNNETVNTSNGVPKLIGGFDFNSRLTEIENVRGNTTKAVNVSATVGTGGQARNPVNTAAGVTADCLTYNASSSEICVTRFVYPMNSVSNDTSVAKNPGYSQICRYKHNENNPTAFDKQGDYYIPCDRIQGVAFVGNYIVVSRSYVRNPNTAGYISMIEFYYKDKTITVNGQTCQMPTGHCLVMPAMVEGVAYYNDRLYVSFESGANTFTDCHSRVDRIAALDISADLAYLNSLLAKDPDRPGYTRVIDLGMVRYEPDSKTSATANKVECDSDGYEQVMLDKDYTGVDGAVYKYNGDAQKVYRYNSNVKNGEKLLVRLHDGFDLVTKVNTQQYTGEGFYVEGGGELTIRSVQSVNLGDEITLRRNRFGTQSVNSTFTATVVNVGKGGTLKVDNRNIVSDYAATGKSYADHARIVFRGGTSNYVEAEGAMINTINKYAGGSNGISSWELNGVTFRQIQGTASNELSALFAYGNFSNFSVTNCNFEDVYSCTNQNYSGADDSTDPRMQGREGAAVLFSASYNSPKTTFENCTFDNAFCNDSVSGGHKFGPTLAVAYPVSYEAIRFDGGIDTNDVTFKNVTFKNFKNDYTYTRDSGNNNDVTTPGATAPKKGIVGFTNINSKYNSTSKAIVYTRTQHDLNNITIDGITMQNCETRLSNNAEITVDGTKELHYDGPLTFSKSINKVEIKGDVLFQNCNGWGAGAIAFGIDSVIPYVTIQGSGVDRSNSVETSSTVRFLNCKGYKNGGAIGIYGDNSVEPYKSSRGIYASHAGTDENGTPINDGYFNIDNVLIDGCTSTNGSAIMIYGGAAVKNMNLTNSVVRNCESVVHKRIDGDYVEGNNYAGTIRTTGPVSCVLKIDNCDILDNKVWKDGGGIYWNAKGSKDSITSKLVVTNTNIYNNKAAESGAGIYCEADMEINNTNIYGNVAGEDGGGICQTVYDNDKEPLLLKKTSLSLDSGVKVYDNTARWNGGGVAMVFRYSDNAYATKLTNAASDQARDYTLDFQTVQNPAVAPEIYNNTAGAYGGGVYYGTGVAANTGSTNDGVYSSTEDTMITSVSLEELQNDQSAKQPTVAQKQKLVASYKKNVNLYSGSIHNNTACDSGGGIYVKGKKAKINVENNQIYSNTAGKASATDITYLATSDSGKTLTPTTDSIPAAADDNKKYNGGGVAILGVDASCSISAGSHIYQNSAYKRGGGIYSGLTADITVDGGTIDRNTASQGGGVALVCGDTSITGTTNKIDGLISVSGGSIDKNSSSAQGGGIWVSADNADNATTLKVEVTGGTISGNSSDTNGGGIWVFDPKTNGKASVLVDGGNIDGNSAVLRGGGLFSNGGNITIENGYVQNNEVSNGGGGGICAYKGGVVTVKGGLIRWNKANGEHDTTTYENTMKAIPWDKEARFVGAGGGILIADGASAAKKTKFEIKASSYKGMGIYGNEATYAADDVCATGNNTALDVPNVSAMDLSEYNRHVIGWFEDYPNNDTQYASGTYIGQAQSSAVKNTAASRYRSVYQIYDAKYKIDDVNAGATISGGVTGAVVNADDAYICMTLGVSAFIDVKKEVYAANGDLLSTRGESVYNKYKDRNYTFTISRVDGTAMTDAEKKYIHINSDGTFDTTEYSTTNGVFTLKDGESVRFPYLVEGKHYKVVEKENEYSDVFKTETTIVYNQSTYASVDPYVSGGNSFNAAELDHDFYANIVAHNNKNVTPASDNSVTVADRLSITAGSTSWPQMWHFIHQANGSYKIKNVSTGTFLAVKDYNGTTSATVFVAAEEDTENQQWNIYQSGEKYFFTPVAYPSLAIDLDANGNTLVQTRSFHGGSNQLFSIDKSCGTDVANLGDDFYARINYTSGNQNVSIDADNFACVAGVDESDPKQLWRFVRQSDGSYLISNGSNRYCLDNANNTDDLNTYDRYVVATDNSTSSQRWFIYTDGSEYYFRAANTVTKQMDKNATAGGEQQLGQWSNADGKGVAVNRRFAITKVDSSQVAEPSNLTAEVSGGSGVSATVKFLNYIATDKMPSTGGCGTQIYIIIGGLISAFFISAIGVRIIRRRRSAIK